MYGYVFTSARNATAIGRTRIKLLTMLPYAGGASIIGGALIVLGALLVPANAFVVGFVVDDVL